MGRAVGLTLALASCTSATASPSDSAPTTALPVAPSSTAAPRLVPVPAAHVSVLGAPRMTTPTSAAPTATVGDSISAATEPSDGAAPRPAPAALVDNPFAEPVAGWFGGDIPRIYPLPDGRQIWWLADSFFPVDGAAPVDQFDMVRNVAFVRGVDGSLTPLLGSRDGAPWDFLAHLDADHFHRFFWPLGGVVDGDVLRVFVAEMQCDDPQWGICARPVTTYLATYTWADMSLVSIVPAPNAGVRPVYGFSVASDDEWTYLFGAGMEYNTPDIAGGSDQTYVARVPVGKLDQAPAYWDGTAWVADPARAVPLIQQGNSDFRMSVVRWHDRWIGVAKEDEFVGPAIFVKSAPNPQGPWTNDAVIRFDPPASPDLVTYDAQPYPEPVDGRLAIVYSANSMIEQRVFADPSVYRPVVLLTDVR